MARHEKQRRETTGEFCKRLGIVQVKGAKDGVELPLIETWVRSQPASDEEPQVDEMTQTVIRKCVDYGVSSLKKKIRTIPKRRNQMGRSGEIRSFWNFIASTP